VIVVDIMFSAMWSLQCCVKRRTEEEKSEWLKALEDTIHDSLRRRLSFNVGKQQTLHKTNVSNVRHFYLISPNCQRHHPTVSTAAHNSVSDGAVFLFRNNFHVTQCTESHFQPLPTITGSFSTQDRYSG